MDKCVEYVVVERQGQTFSVHGGDSFNIPLSPLATIPSLQYPAKGREIAKEKRKTGRIKSLISHSCNILLLHSPLLFL